MDPNLPVKLRSRITKEGATILHAAFEAGLRRPTLEQQLLLWRQVQASPYCEHYQFHNVERWFSRHRRLEELQKPAIPMFPTISRLGLERLQILFEASPEPTQEVVEVWAQLIQASVGDVSRWIAQQRQSQSSLEGQVTLASISATTSLSHQSSPSPMPDVMEGSGLPMRWHSYHSQGSSTSLSEGERELPANNLHNTLSSNNPSLEHPVGIHYQPPPSILYLSRAPTSKYLSLSECERESPANNLHNTLSGSSPSLEHPFMHYLFSAPAFKSSQTSSPSELDSAALNSIPTWSIQTNGPYESSSPAVSLYTGSTTPSESSDDEEPARGHQSIELSDLSVLLYPSLKHLLT
ncbi:hypothetical protein EV360DRAFT_79838 [Lentinula raphanica]|nr:hypothetical protein EV360DRAFT_79838 [Lentinula raphanica]